MLERPHVIYNDTTHKYVLWGHHVIASGHSTAVVAYNDSPTGAFTVATSSYNPDGLYLNDMNLFKDIDGQAYLLYSIGTNTQFVISRLTSDYLQTSGTYITPAVLAGREAPAMILRNGVYFLLTSALTGWAPNENKYSTSTSVMGTWSSLVDPFQSSPLEDRLTAYHSQTTDIERIPGRNDAYIYIGDRFDYSNTLAGSLYNSRHIWLPITFPTNNTMSITWQPSWNLNDFSSIDPPLSATNFQAEKNGFSVNLTWINNETDDFMLFVDRASDVAFSQNVVSDLLPSHASSFTDNYGISDGNTYYYRVRTVNFSGTGNSSTVIADFSSDVSPPSVSVSNPTEGQIVSGQSVNLVAAASDNVAVSSLTFYVDGTSFVSSSSSSPFGASFDSRLFADGNHLIKAVAVDSSGNIATSSTVNFFVHNDPSPIISNLSTSALSNGVLVSWVTNTLSSSIVDFGLTRNYGTSTSEKDSLIRVLNHSISIGALVPCSIYHFRVRSRDFFLEEAVSADDIFSTLGCSGGASFSTSTSAEISAVSGGSLNLIHDESGLNLSVPPNFSSRSSADFQIKKLDKNVYILNSFSY
jgi:hypothetical protein